MILAHSLEIFKNLSQCEIEGVYYDLHNDYDCQKISLINESLILLFQPIKAGKLSVLLTFEEASVACFDFYNVENVKNLTIDNLYRGKFEFNGDLIEFSLDRKAYFYLDFYEGQKIEFWASGFTIESPSPPAPLLLET